MKLRDKLERLQMPGTRAPSGMSGEPPPSEPDSCALAVHDARVERDEVHEGEEEMRSRPMSAARVEHNVQLDDTQSPCAPLRARTEVLGGLRARLDAMKAPRAAIPSRSFASQRAQQDEESREPTTHGHGVSSFAAALTRSFSGLPRARVPAPVQKLPAERTDTAHGPLHRVVVTHAADHRHGSAEVALAVRVCAAEVALLALDPALADVDFSRALYIDTETTGLSGGTGTLPFLIGMAWFEGDRLVVEQLLLPRPGLETPMLARLAERIAASSVIVSYNGKSFDWPLLRTRFILNRIAAPKLPQHLDLLHCARRVYKSRLGSLRLIFLEQALMGFEREDDIPGELIPETYLSFLRGSTPGEALTPIIDHNRSDLVALPALLGEIVRRFLGEHARQDARDQLGFARVAARAAASTRAIELAHAAVEADVRGELAAAALFLVGELKLRADDVEGALQAFEGALAASVSAFDLARAHLALAKLHEHKTKLPARALAHAAHTAACEGEDACQKRVERLQARAVRAASSNERRQRSDARSRKCTREEVAS